MTTQQITIFNGNLSSNAENLSTVFSSGLGFYLIAPGASFDYQVDIYLQVQVSNTQWRQVRLDPLNVSTTQRITLIPQQITDLSLPMRLAIAPSQGFLLEVILLQNDCDSCSDSSSKIDGVIERLEDLAAVSQVITDTISFLSLL